MAVNSESFGVPDSLIPTCPLFQSFSCLDQSVPCTFFGPEVSSSSGGTPLRSLRESRKRIQLPVYSRNKKSIREQRLCTRSSAIVVGRPMNVVKVFKVTREWMCLAALLTATCCFAQSDPGPRAGAPGAGAAISGLTPGELDFFNNHGIPQFSQVEGVADGLGPRFNLDSCGGCHIQPALGGSSPATNPQLARALTMAPGNTVPSFITANGPVREARFIRKADGSPDGGVHDLFTIAGRPDTPAGCSIQQPDFAGQQGNHNVIFRIPTPTFGAGLIEAITDTTIRTNLASASSVKANNGIRGHVNTNGNDGTVTRFGWKAQNKSLLIFSGEAYNVEMGISNENFQNEREESGQCATNATPENQSAFNVGTTHVAD